MAPKVKQFITIITYWVGSISLTLVLPFAFLTGLVMHLCWWVVVLPEMHRCFQSYTIAILLFITELFLFVNFFVNMVLDFMTSSKATVFKSERYCDSCVGYVLKDSWHCRRCNLCIVRREEHCVVINRCVGLFNRRYHTLMFTYGTLCCVLMAHCAILIFFKHGTDLLYEEVKTSVLGKYFVVPKTGLNVRRLLMRYFQIVIISLVFSITLGYNAVRHWECVLRGVTLREKRYGEAGTKDWRKNMENVFGCRWRSALFWPFIKSLGLKELDRTLV